MTKTECIIEDLGFKRVPDKDMQEEKHNGSYFTVRVWEFLNDGDLWTIWCDSYYGRSIVFWNGTKLGDYEYRYERIPYLLSNNPS